MLRSGVGLQPGKVALDRVCAPCETPMTTGIVWTDGCAFECVAGFYLLEVCLPCTRNLSCAPGTFETLCALALDAASSPSPDAGEGVVWQRGCLFGCVSGSYFFSPSANRCVQCTSECGPGTYASPCTAVSDSACVGCLSPGGAFVWTERCLFRCTNGYQEYNGTFCLLPDIVPVHAALTLNNTVREVCLEMGDLLLAISEVLNGGQFVTNVTSFDGVLFEASSRSATRAGDCSERAEW